MPVTTRSQRRAIMQAYQEEAIKAMAKTNAKTELPKQKQINTLNSNFSIISSTTKYKDIIACLDHGRVKTMEKIIMKKGATTFEINFKYCFSYDWSNGLHNVDEPQEIKIVKTDGTIVTDNEKSFILFVIKRTYKFNL